MCIWQEIKGFDKSQFREVFSINLQFFLLNPTTTCGIHFSLMKLSNIYEKCFNEDRTIRF